MAFNRTWKGNHLLHQSVKPDELAEVVMLSILLEVSQNIWLEGIAWNISQEGEVKKGHELLGDIGPAFWKLFRFI